MSDHCTFESNAGSLLRIDREAVELSIIVNHAEEMLVSICDGVEGARGHRCAQS